MAVQKVLPLIPLLLCWASNVGFAQTQLVWDDSLVVRATPHYITAPRVKVLVGNGTPLAVWGESSSPAKIWCSRLENGQFSAPVSVVTTDPPPTLFGFGGFDVAVNGLQVFVVFERLGEGIFLARSDDGGQTFLSPVQVEGPAEGSFASFASIAADEQGNVFVNYIQGKNGNTTHQMRHSNDAGLTFAPAVEASAPADGTKVCECCIAAPLASEGNVWLAFRNNDANIRDHWVSRSTDVGETFDLAVDVDNSDWLINVCPISGPRMALSGDSLAVVWKTGAGGGSKVFLSTLHAATLLPGQQIRLGDAAQLSENQNQPDIAASGDTVGIVFQENTRLAFSFSVGNVAALAENYVHWETSGQTLQYPSLAFHDGSFHLAYTNGTAGEVIYRRGRLLPVVGTKAAQSAASLSVSIFPNPSADGLFWLKSDSIDLLECVVWDAFGNRIAHRPLNRANTQIALTGLLPGIYFLQIKTFQGLEIYKPLIIGL